MKKLISICCCMVALLAKAQNVGIGTSSPNAPLHILTSAQSPLRIEGGINLFIPFHESGVYRGYMGSFAGNAEDVDFGTGGSNTTGKLHLTIKASPAMTIDAAGNIGVGTTAPAARLHVVGNLAITSSNTIEFGQGVVGKEANAGKIGYGTFTPGVLDIVGGGTSVPTRKIRLFNEGGATFEGSIAMSSGELTHAKTGNANLLPLAYATIDGSTGAVLAGSGNISANRVGTGSYIVSVTSESLSASTVACSLTIVSDGTTAYIAGNFSSGNMVVRIVSNNNSDRVDRNFSVIMYKL